MSGQAALSGVPNKRRRRTREDVHRLEAQIICVLRRDHPQSVRHVFYRCTDPRLPEPVPKSERGYRQIQDRLATMRKEGRLPYGWLSDTTRPSYSVTTFVSAADFIQQMASAYRADLWRSSDVYCEVWCESRSIAGVVRRLCYELAVPLYPCGGFASMTMAYEASKVIAYGTGYGRKRAVLLFLGDHDPAGVLVDKALETELRRHLPDAVQMDFRRLAVTPEQIASMDLPTKPRKPGDRRSPEVKKTVEAEAIPANTLRELVRREVEALLPARALEVAKVAEQSERDGLYALGEALERVGVDGLIAGR